MIVFQTARTVVRHLAPNDFEALHALCSNPDVMRWMGDGQPLSEEQTQRWIRVSQTNYERHGYGCMAVVDSRRQQMVGFCGLVYAPGTERVELIYAFQPDYWGQGYAAEVAGAMLEWGLSACKLPRIVATIDPLNTASRRVAEKLGMTYQGIVEDEDGEPSCWYVVEAQRP